MKYLQQSVITTAAVLFSGLVYAQDAVPAKPFIIKGRLTEFSQKGKVVLTYFTDHKRKKDTTTVTDGTFEIQGAVKGPGMAFLDLIVLTKDGVPVNTAYDKTNFIKFYIDPGETKIMGTDNLSTAKISGGSTQQDWSVLEKEQQSASDKDQTENLFIEKHPASYVSWDIIKNRSYLNAHPDELERLFNGMDSKYKNSEEGAQIGKNLAIAKTIAIGKPALEFALNDTAGRAVSLKSFRGKYVLIDFWASWCGPCRGENPNVLKAYKQFKDKNFDVIAVSLDSSKDPWMKAVHEDKMPWTQLSDLKGWKSAVALQYGITAIPQNFLLDPDGIIIAKDLRGDKLINKLNEIIK